MKIIRIFFVLVLGCFSTLFAAYSPQLLSQRALPPPTPLLQIHFAEKDVPLSDREKKLIDHIKTSIRYSFFEVSAINPSIAYEIDGMASVKIRHLLNNLCSFQGTRYLEIGTWRGPAFIAALYNNQGNVDYAIGIDDGSAFGGLDDLENNLNQLLPRCSYPYEIYSQDCFTIPVITRFNAPINFYLYDGDHSVASQEKAFTYYDDVLDDTFVVLLDDWNEEPVRQGTFSAFRKLNYEVLFETWLPGPYTLWRNGFYIAVIRKPVK